MTIRGDGTGLVDYELPADMQLPSGSSVGRLDVVVGSLFARLESDEVDFDTTTGNIEFPFGKGQSDLTGKTTWTRIFQDWVFLRLNEMDVSEEVRQAQTLVINSLHQKARELLGF